MNNKLFVKIFFQVFLGGLVFVLLFNYLCDPLQYYRYSPDKKLNENDRWQVAGFIRSFDYNQIVLGTSMTQNFSLEVLKNTLHTKPIRLSVAGLNIQEQSIVLRAALETGKVKSVIWGLDRDYLNYIPNNIDKTFPADLYYQNIKGHLNYLLNLSTASWSIKILSRLHKKEKSDLEHYKAWYKDAEFSKEKVLKLFNDSIRNVELNMLINRVFIHLKKDDSIFQEIHKKCIENFKRDVLQIIQAYPEIKFYIFYPPYSLAHYKLTHRANMKTFNLDSQLRKFIMNELISLPNVEFSDFETDLKIVADLNHYKDLTHYSKEINDIMIHSFGNKTKILTLKDLDENHEKYLSLPKEAIRK